MLSQQIISSFASRTTDGSLPELSLSLLDQQKKTWKQLADGYTALEAIRVREIQCHGFSVRLQFNPGRIVSSGAMVDATSISERKCFLCLENLPEEQKGILYQERFLVLCNPAPIFSQHYTISNLKHVPQEIATFAGAFLSLAKDFSPGFTVFYNGPKCGASAPDHMHFQASPSGVIPVEQDAGDARRRGFVKKVGAVSCLTIQEYGRRVIVLESSDGKEFEACIVQLLRSMKDIFATSDEPMLNILCSFRQKLWRAIVFPRRKHRPDIYFRDGDAKILVSPAAVDLGGLIITPIEKDFRKVGATTIEDIFDEVSVEESVLEKILSDL